MQPENKCQPVKKGQGHETMQNGQKVIRLAAGYQSEIFLCPSIYIIPFCKLFTGQQHGIFNSESIVPRPKIHTLKYFQKHFCFHRDTVLTKIVSNSGNNTWKWKKLSFDGPISFCIEIINLNMYILIFIQYLVLMVQRC